jgi:hypothetical protein
VPSTIVPAGHVADGGLVGEAGVSLAQAASAKRPAATSLFKSKRLKAMALTPLYIFLRA